METKRVEYLAPTKRAFGGMKSILFRPFEIQKWFVLGFSAWLAALGEGGGSSGTSSDFGSDDFSNGEEEFSGFLDETLNWLEENLMMVVTIGAILLLLVLLIGTLLLWIQSRGKFMFFDNVVHDRTRISEPWKEFREIANSLFVWKLTFVLLVSFAILSLVGGILYLLWPSIEAESFDRGVLAPVIMVGFLVLVLGLAASYIQVLLENFVIPIMHRERIPASPAWRRLLALHRDHPGDFLVFFLWMILIGIGTGLAVFALIIGTCCIAAIPLIIPYLGTVLLLPLSVFLRLIGPEFLKQFGTEYDTLATAGRPPLPLN